MQPPLDPRSSSAPRTPSGGDLASVEGELAPRFWERIRLFAVRRVRDAAAAEDIAQEVLRLVAKALRAGRVENIDAVPGYVLSTAHHLCLQRFRSSSREDRAISRLGAEPGPDSKAQDPLQGLIKEERRIVLREALRDLSAPDRELLTLLYYHDVGAAAVATRLDISPDQHVAARWLAFDAEAVRSTLARAIGTT